MPSGEFEIELKLAVHGTFSLPAFDPDATGVAEVAEMEPLELRATYYDTADLRLARYGITLRYRTGEEKGPIWSLKLPVSGRDVTQRSELLFEGPAGRVPEQARDLVTAFARSEALGLVATLRTRRRRWMLRDSLALDLAELVDDEVSVMDGGRIVGRFRELEVEARGLDLGGLRPIADTLLRAGATAAEPIPKAVRALGARATAPPDVQVPSGIGPGSSAGEIVAAALAAGVERLIQHDPVARIGEDPEGVHQMRVAARRIRSDLRTFRPLVLEAWATPIREELRWLAGVLGAVRDVDVLTERFRTTGEDLLDDIQPLFGLLAQRRDAARAGLLGALRGDRYRALLDTLVAAARTPALTGEADRPAPEVLPPLAARPWRKLRSAVAALGDEPSEEALHDVRIQAKRVRYAAEAVADGLPSGDAQAARSFAKRCAQVQDILGSHQDAIVAAQLIQEVATTQVEDAVTHLALGRLLERQMAGALGERRAFVAAYGTLEKKKARRWLDA